MLIIANNIIFNLFYFEIILGEREYELSVLEATFFIDVAKPSTIDTARYYRLLYVKFFISNFFFSFLSGKIKTCLCEGTVY